MDIFKLCWYVTKLHFLMDKSNEDLGIFRSFVAY